MRGNGDHLLRAAGALLVLLAAGTGGMRAEVSAELHPDNVSVIVLGIIEGPDPIPQVLWAPVRDIDPSLYLNPGGADRGDGRPDIAIDPLTGWPHVVWAYHNGSDFDIAYTQWNGSGWDPPQFLTSSTAQQLDPRVYVDDVGVYVVWWEEASKAIRFVKRPRAGSWGVTESIAGHTGARPSVVTWGGTIFVASEKVISPSQTQIYVSTRLGQNTYNTQPVLTAPQNEPLNVVLHSEHGLLWMDWRNSSTQFAYSVYDGSAWAPSATIPWLDDSWVKLEEVRNCVRAIVLGSP